MGYVAKSALDLSTQTERDVRGQITKAGVPHIVLPGEPVTGLDKDEITRLLAMGAIEGSEEEKPEAKSEPKTAKRGI